LRENLSGSQISYEPELRRQAKVTIHREPACVEMQIVCLPSLGMNTASTESGRANFSSPPGSPNK